MSYNFSLDRTASITLGAGSVLLLILMFVAGVLTGLTWRSNSGAEVSAAKPIQPAAQAKKNSPSPAVSSMTAASMAPADSKVDASSMPATPSPVQASSPAPPALADTVGANVPNTNAPADAKPPAPAPKPPALLLAVQVGAFLQRENAEKLSARLKDEGYTPQITTGVRGFKQWNFVRIGPYQDWEQATEIAALLSRDQTVQAVVRPMR